jgi:prepilin-type N-terminal cleavage/methylation domain-containing protein
MMSRFGVFSLGKSQRGYTLIEIMVVVAVIGILSVITFTSLNGSNQREQSRQSAITLRSDLRSVQEQALANKVDSSGNSAAYYGILLGNDNSASHTSYSIVRIDKSVTPQCTTGSGVADCNSTIVSTIKLPQGVTITANPNYRLLTFTEFDGKPTFFDSGGSAITTGGPVTISVNGLSGGPLTVSLTPVTGQIQ